MYGTISVFYGPVKSGKTSNIHRDIDSHLCRGRKVIYINSSVDVREESVGHDSTSSHNHFLRQQPQGLREIKSTSLKEVDVSEYDVIAVDEGQFFDDLVECCLAWIRQGKDVIVGGLDLDYLGKPFGSILILANFWATKKKNLLAFCDVCIRHNRDIPLRRTATRSYRIGSETDLVLIDDSKYEARCLYHYEN